MLALLKRFNAIFRFEYAIAMMVAFVVVYVSIIPPLQSPDEPDHIKRAYWLSHGQIVLESEAGRNSGGYVDTGLLRYLKLYGRHAWNKEERLGPETFEIADALTWSGVREFSSAAGTGYYFPLVYLPHALGLGLGQILDLGIDASYRTARALAAATSILILILSFVIFRPPPLVLALLLLPMTLFQASSATIDGVSSALAILSLSLFLKNIQAETSAGHAARFWMMVGTIFLVTSCRTHLLPMIMMPYVVYLLKRERVYLYGALFLTLATLIWLYVAIRTTHVAESHAGFPISVVGAYYINNPIAFFEVFVATVTNADLMKFYLHSFIGILGWLDASFSAEYYDLMLLLLIIILLSSVRWGDASQERRVIARLTLATMLVSSLFIIFLAMLITWTPHPAVHVVGVQGRYFLVPVIFIAYILNFEAGLVKEKIIPDLIGKFALLVLGCVSAYGTIGLIAERYYVSSAADTDIVSQNVKHDQVHGGISKGRVLEQSFVAKGGSVFSIRLFLATYSRKNTGLGSVRVLNESGDEIYTHSIDVSMLKDNAWYVMNLEHLQVEKNKKYYLRVTSEQEDLNNVFTWWAARADAYPSGEALINGRPVGGDFTFKVLYEK